MIPEKNWLEWTIFGVSLLLVLGTIGLLIGAAVTGDNGPPAIRIELGEASAQGERYTVPVTAINDGGATAADVHLRIELHRQGAEPEEGELTIQYLPRHARREGWVTFGSDPRRGTLVPRVLGYEKP